MHDEYEINVGQLVDLGCLIQEKIQAIVNESTNRSNTSGLAPSWALYSAKKTIISATGTLVELVSDPSLRLMEYSGQYWESRALAIVAAKRIPDILSSSATGVPLPHIAAKSGVECAKMGRILRCLCSSHILKEPEPDIFANNRISSALVNNEPLRAYILMFHADLFSCAEHLPHTLFDREWGPSYDVHKTAFQRAMGTSQSRWEWLEGQPLENEGISEAWRTNYPGIPGQETVVKQSGAAFQQQRPELQLFSVAMVGGGRVTTRTHVEDYPWQDLGHATVVDVGGGVGGFMLELSKRYHCLKFVIQDTKANIKLAKELIWPQEGLEAIRNEQVSFMEYDFFRPNPVQGADVYWLRFILHDWADGYCHDILSILREAMTARSRLLICEQVMDTTADTITEAAPQPLLANYGVYKRYSHQRDLDMMAIINGIERTPAQFEKLFRQAGLQLTKVWPCRSQVSIMEVRHAL
ncbi:S-adenosyl-L-methionine-dependent methyltransferase [Aspergillus campestris IBT 28561]|uniref:S-adenosyl-L-methionine-dependent methyltransferase n=1 Tax=Aspergillus campestris (strain IBT 28561) TaxID=1392248 RepID=A0A2I1D3V2_ASPC2|nr:S-adenosyl-L-methionine-dependent methyltransferase [Aspergillus campestris IBT 28561]PKY04557.1 S-adenosyl-L-methionine-dependent methyltransferase [Aspergillus campestris IBT 28561]